MDVWIKRKHLKKMLKVFKNLRGTKYDSEKTYAFLKWRLWDAYQQDKKEVHFVLNSWENIKRIHPILLMFKAKCEVSGFYEDRAHELQ